MALDGVWMLGVPTIVAWLIAVLASIEHFIHRKNLLFQGIYLRALSLFPLVATIACLAGSFVQAFYWIEILIGFVEGYVFMLFFGLFIGWAWHNGNVLQRLRDAPHSSTCCFCVGHSVGTKYETGQKAQNHLRWLVYQFGFVKVSINITKAIIHDINGEVGKGLKLGLGLVNLVSIAICIQSLFRLYRALKIKPNLLIGLKAFAKFTVVKALLLFVVLNNLIFQNLISAGTMQPPAALCVGIDNSIDDACNLRFGAFIFILEGLVLLLCAIFVFRAKDMDILESKLAEDEKFEYGHGSPVSLFFRYFCILDVCTIMLRKPAHVTYPDDDDDDDEIESREVELESGLNGSSTPNAVSI